MKYCIIVFCVLLFSCNGTKKNNEENWLRANELVNTFEVLDSVGANEIVSINDIVSANLLVYNQKAYLVIANTLFDNMNGITPYVEFSIPLPNPTESLEGTYVFTNNEEGQKLFTHALVTYYNADETVTNQNEGDDFEDVRIDALKMSGFKNGELQISQVNDTSYVIKFWLNNGSTTNVVNGSYTGTINRINFLNTNANQPIDMSDFNSFISDKYYNSGDDESLSYQYSVDIIANDVLFPLTVIDENGQKTLMEREAWQGISTTNNLFNILTYDSVNYEKKYKECYLLDIDGNKSYVFQKINDRVMLTRIEPIRADLDFVTFYKKFITDVTYRRDHVKFPIKQEIWVLDELELDTIYQQNNWDSTDIAKNYRFYETKNCFIISFISDNSKETACSSSFYFGEGAFGYDDRFKKDKDGKWYLVKLSEGSD